MRRDTPSSGGRRPPAVDRAGLRLVLAGTAVVGAGALAAVLVPGSGTQQLLVGLVVAALAAGAGVVTALPMARELRRLRRRDRALARFSEAATACPAIEEALAAGVVEVVADAALVGLHHAGQPSAPAGLEGVVATDALATGLPATVPDGTTGRETARLLALPVAQGGPPTVAVVLRVGDVSEQDVADLQHLLARLAPSLPGPRNQPPLPPAVPDVPAVPAVPDVPDAGTRAGPSRGSDRGAATTSQATAPEDGSAADPGLHDLVARGAHDLRTPLNTLTGMVETLVRHGEELSPSQRDELHAALQRATRRIGGWITTLLDAAVQDEPRPTGPAGVQASRLQDLLEEAAMVSSAATAGLEVYVAPTDLLVDADPGVVVRIVGNLLTNAGHHAGSGDTVEVEARPLGDQVEVSVRDHGVGWDGSPPVVGGPAHRSVNHHAGLGLGLASVRAHVAALGGQLELDETPGGGATVRFTLPRAAAASAEADGTAEPGLRWTIAGRQSHVHGDTARAARPSERGTEHDLRR